MSSADELPPALDRLAEEFVARERRGERPTVDEYVQRHPELADPIRELFPVLSVMEGVKEGPPDASAFHELGDHELLREIGRGGMGVVYEAVQRTLGRRVALKILPPGATLDTRYLERFRQEAQAAARLQHPNIVPVIGLGEHENVHYYTMQYIDGQGLDVVLDALRATRQGRGDALSEASAALVDRLFTTDVGASSGTGAATRVGARTAGSPSAAARGSRRRYAQNVARIGLQAAEALVYAHAQGVLHRDIKPSNLLLDARGRVWITDFGLCREREGRDLTQSGDVVGTLRYVPPERLDGLSDVRGDVYGLGVTLYELLTLETAHPAKARSDLLMQIANRTPPRPRQLDRDIPRDLETIVTRAMAREPDRRYPTAEALAADLRAYLDGRPIAARPPSLGYLLRVALRRHRALALTAAAALVVVVASTAYYVAGLRSKERRARREHYVASIAAAETALRDGDVHLARQLLEGAPAEHRNWEWRHFHSRLDESLRSLPSPARIVPALAYRPDGSHLATAAGAEVRVYDHVTGQLVRTLAADSDVRSLAWDPEGTRLAAGTAAALWVWDWPSGRRRHEIALPDAVRAVHYGRRGVLVSGGDDGRVRIWDAESGMERRHLEARSRVYALALAPDDEHLLTGTWDGRVTLWEIASGRRLWSIPLHRAGVNAVAFVGDDAAVSASVDGLVRLFSWRGGEERRTLAHTESVPDLAVSSDARRLATIEGQRLRIWDVATGEEVYTIRSHGRFLRSVAFHPGGARVVTGSFAGTIREWDLSLGRDPNVFAGHMDDVLALAFDARGRRLASGGMGGVLCIWDMETGELERTWIGHEGSLLGLAFHPGGGQMVAGDDTGQIVVWDPVTGAVLHRVRAHEEAVWDVCYTPDGKRIATVAGDGTVGLFDAESGRRIAVLEASERPLHAAAVSPDGSWLAAGGEDGVVRLFGLASLTLERVLRGHEGGITGLAFHPGGHRLATVSLDQTLRVWEVADGSSLATIREKDPDLGAHTDALTDVTYTPDGSRIATGSRDGSVRLWDAVDGRLVATLRGHRGWIHAVAFSPDGRRLASCSGGAKIRLWDTRSVRDGAPLRARARALRDRAQPLVERCSREASDVDELLEHVEALVGVDPAVHEAARRLAHALRGRTEALYARLWKELTPEAGDGHRLRVARAIAGGLARASGHRDVQDSRAFTLAGMAEVRCGAPRHALHYLERAVRMNEEVAPDLHATDLAFLTLAYESLGRESDARRSLDELRTLLAAHPEADSPRTRAFLAEARRAVDGR